MRRWSQPVSYYFGFTAQSSYDLMMLYRENSKSQDLRNYFFTGVNVLPGPKKNPQKKRSNSSPEYIVNDS